MQHKDADLLEQALYSELYRCHGPALFAFAYRQTASREDAEDIVLDVFLSLLQNTRFPTFDAKKQEAWLWTITRNKVVDHYRRSTSRSHVPIEWLSEQLYVDEQLTPEQFHLKREEYVQLSNAMQMLSKNQQEVLLLRFGHGLKCKEIAPVIGKNEGTVRTILFRALQHLRGIYRDLGKGGKR